MPLRPRQQGSAAYGHRLVLDSLDLPVLEIDRHPPPEESNGGHEAVPAAAPDDRADEPLRGPTRVRIVAPTTWVGSGAIGRPEESI